MAKQIETTIPETHMKLNEAFNNNLSTEHFLSLANMLHKSYSSLLSAGGDANILAPEILKTMTQILENFDKFNLDYTAKKDEIARLKNYSSKILIAYQRESTYQEIIKNLENENTQLKDQLNKPNDNSTKSLTNNNIETIIANGKKNSHVESLVKNKSNNLQR